MKRAITVLAVLLMAVTTYTQTSRRTASTNRSARSERNSTQVSQKNNTSSGRTAAQANTNRSTTNSTRVNRSSDTRQNRSSYERTNTKSSSSRGSVSNTRTPRSSTTTRTTTTATNNRPTYGTTRTTRTTTTSPGHRVNRTTTAHHPPKVHYRERYPATRYSTSRVYRGHHTVTYAHNYKPYSKNYREVHYVYREPAHVHVVWTRNLHRHYIKMYPHIHWEYRYGYTISSVSAYYADYYIGDVRTVYGKVKEVFYSPESDEFFLYIGDYYPYHDFTIVLPGYIARDYTRRPMAYFTNQYVNVTGLITEFEEKPEIVVKRRFQLDVY